MYGYPSQPCLHELCNEAECKISPEGKCHPVQSEHYITLTRQEDKVMDLSTIVEDNEGNSSGGKISDRLFGEMEERDNIVDVSASDHYLKDVEHCMPCQDRLQQRWEDGKSERESLGIEPTSSAVDDSTAHQEGVVIDGYVEESMLNDEGLCLQKADANKHETTGQYIRETDTHCEFELKADDENVRSHDEQQLNTVMAEDSGNEADSPAPSEYSTDSVFALPLDHHCSAKPLSTYSTHPCSTEATSKYITEDSDASDCRYKLRLPLTPSDSCSAAGGSGCSYVPSTPSSGYVSETRLSRNKEGSLTSQVSCDTPRGIQPPHNSCWAHSEEDLVPSDDEDKVNHFPTTGDIERKVQVCDAENDLYPGSVKTEMKLATTNRLNTLSTNTQYEDSEYTDMYMNTLPNTSFCGVDITMMYDATAPPDDDYHLHALKHSPQSPHFEPGLCVLGTSTEETPANTGTNSGYIDPSELHLVLKKSHSVSH